MGRFAPGQVVTVFRSRLREDAAPGYHDTADEMLALARQMPGFVDFKSFHADDGERVSLVTFADQASQDGWREHVAHREAQRRGRADWYAAYSIQVSNCTKAHEFEA
jgi:heme-degrading monooxygenase HmoA